MTLEIGGQNAAIRPKTPDSGVSVATRLRGFTLLELVVTIAILGVLAAYISVRWQPVSSITIGQQTELLAQHIRHIQTLSTTWGVALRLVPGGTGYSVVCVNGTGSAPCVNAGDTVIDPVDNGPFLVTLGEGVTVSGFATEFDAGGRPVNGAALLTADRVFTLSVGGQNRTVRVKPVTGFVVTS